MQLLTKTLIVTLGWLFLASSQHLPAAEPNFGDWQKDKVAAELIALEKEYMRLAEQWEKSIPEDDGVAYTDEKISDEEWLKQAQKEGNRHPDTKLLQRYLAIAERNSDSPFALDALNFIIIRGGVQTADVHGEAWRLKERAIDIVAKPHMQDPRVAYVFDLLADALPSHKAEAFLRAAIAEAPDRGTRAAAGYHLARYLKHLHHVHKRSTLLAEKKTPHEFRALLDAGRDSVSETQPTLQRRTRLCAD